MLEVVPLDQNMESLKSFISRQALEDYGVVPSQGIPKLVTEYVTSVSWHLFFYMLAISIKY